MRTWIELNHKAVYHNVEQISQFCQSPIAAVIKANAYGHGMQEMAQLYAAHPHVRYLAVAHATEALELTTLAKPILVLAHSSEYVEELIAAGIHITIFDKKLLHECAYYARKLCKKALVHLKVDTGMNRLGISPNELVQIVQSLPPEIQLVGISTHLNDKDAEDSAYTEHQLKLFDHCIAQLPDHIVTHALSSGALEYSLHHSYSMPRVGTHLYGFWSSKITQDRLGALKPDFRLQPIATWKSSIIQIKQISKGSCVGYGRTFEAPRDMTIAIIPVGYADGYPRQLSNKGFMRIKGIKVPVIGIVSMNLIALDVTHIPDISYQDEVNIFDGYYESSVERAAELCNTIQIDLTTKINSDLKRLVVDQAFEAPAPIQIDIPKKHIIIPSI